MTLSVTLPENLVCKRCGGPLTINLTEVCRMIRRLQPLPMEIIAEVCDDCDRMNDPQTKARVK